MIPRNKSHDSLSKSYPISNYSTFKGRAAEGQQENLQNFELTTATVFQVIEPDFDVQNTV